MTPERWREIEELFHTAAAQPIEEQNGFLKTACAGDESLRREVVKLLARDRAPNGSFDKITSEVATSWMLESERHELIGQSFDRYEILAPLGTGGMGEVYLARDKRLDRKVALKLLPRQFTQDPDRLRRFEQEARAASALNHPNIITIYEIGEWNGVHFIATEYIEGETLRDHMQKSGRELSEILEIGLQTAGALAAAHAAGIIHRDIKPANIMLRRDGYIKVLDFGLAKLSTASADPDVTGPGRVMGTINYMSPEQALGQAVDHRTDIFSLGAVLYELASGHRPFEGKSDAAIYDGILNKAPPPLTDFDVQFAAELDQVLRGTLKKDRERRYRSASDLRSDLKLLMQGNSAARAGLIASKGPRRARKKLTWRSAALAALVVGALGGLWLRQWPDKMPGPGKKSIAVLPFENLSAGEENAFFADAVHEEILTNLAKVADLKVISRTSVMSFRGKQRNLREVANALQVSHVVEGSAQRTAGGVRVMVQLIDAQTDTHLWAEKYDRELANVFTVQSDVAQAIAGQLQARVTSREREAITYKPTSNPAAYDAYLRALAYDRRTESAPKRRQNMQRFYRQAVRLDPEFALAWARLAIAESALYRTAMDRTPERRRAAQQAMETALRLRPDLGEVHLAQGYYYYSVNDYQTARVAFDEAIRVLPNSADVFYGISLMAVRQGKFPEALKLHQRMVGLDPRNPQYLFHHACSYLYLGQYPQARVLLDRALSLTPGDAETIATKAASYQAEGNLEAAGELLRPLALQPSDDAVFATQMRQILLERRYEEAIARLKPALRNTALFSNQSTVGYYPLLGLAQERSGDSSGAAAVYLEGRATIQRLRKTQNDSYTLALNLALVQAGLGDKEAALRELKRAVERWPLNAMFARAAEEAGAAINARFGENDSALESLIRLLEVPYFWMDRKTPVTRALLKLDPIWDPLRNDPRFQKLLADPKPETVYH